MIHPANGSHLLNCLPAFFPIPAFTYLLSANYIMDTIQGNEGKRLNYINKAPILPFLLWRGGDGPRSRI